MDTALAVLQADHFRAIIVRVKLPLEHEAVNEVHRFGADWKDW